MSFFSIFGTLVLRVFGIQLSMIGIVGSIITNTFETRLREALNLTARIIMLRVVMDVIYQVLVLKAFYPAESAVIALVLAFLPYVLIRGLVLRVARARASAAGVL